MTRLNYDMIHVQLAEAEPITEHRITSHVGVANINTERPDSKG